MLLTCPATLYASHLGPVIGPVVEHVRYRLERNWAPVMDQSKAPLARPLFSSDCSAAAVLAARGGEEWYSSYYGRSGLFVGDLDAVTAEAAIEKSRVEVSRTYCDVLQAALALKGGW